MPNRACALQVKKGDAGNLPLKMLIDMSNNVQPLFREWRARIWSLGARGHQPGVVLDEPASSAAASLAPADGITAGFITDSDDDGLREPCVSSAVASAQLARARDRRWARAQARQCCSSGIRTALGT
jgi:hypothetical protein